MILLFPFYYSITGNFPSIFAALGEANLTFPFGEISTSFPVRFSAYLTICCTFFMSIPTL